MTRISFDERVANELLGDAHMVVARGYIHNSLGNNAIRAPWPNVPHGVAYTKGLEYQYAESVMYPSREATRCPQGGARLA